MLVQVNLNTHVSSTCELLSDIWSISAYAVWWIYRRTYVRMHNKIGPLYTLVGGSLRLAPIIHVVRIGYVPLASATLRGLVATYAYKVFLVRTSESVPIHIAPYACIWQGRRIGSCYSIVTRVCMIMRLSTHRSKLA